MLLNSRKETLQRKTFILRARSRSPTRRRHDTLRLRGAHHTNFWYPSCPKTLDTYSVMPTLWTYSPNAVEAGELAGLEPGLAPTNEDSIQTAGLESLIITSCCRC